MQDKQDLENRINELENMIAEKEQIIASQHAEIEKISNSFNEVETSALKQNEVLKNLMQVAENKIVTQFVSDTLAFRSVSRPGMPPRARSGVFAVAASRSGG